MARRWKVPPLGSAAPPGVFALVRGCRPFLNVSAQDGHQGALYHMSDRRQLRSLAEAILDALAKSEPVARKGRR